MTQTQLVTQALVLALCAPDEEKAQMAAELAEKFSLGLDHAAVERCKADALVAAEKWEGV